MTAFYERVDAYELLGAGGLDETLDYLDTVAAGNSAAKAAVDIALHDLFGKEGSVSVRELFGENGLSDTGPGAGERKTRGPGTSFTIGIDSIETMVQKAKGAHGFKTLKIKLNGRNDVDVIAAIRSVTDQQLYVDANRGWDDIDTAIRTCERLVELGVGLIEQPFRQGEAEKAGVLRDICPVPIVADEDVQTIDDIESLAGFYDGINVKLMKAGGIRGALRMIRAARMSGLKVLLGCMTESSIGISAAAQLAHLADWCDLDGNLLIENDTCVGVKTIDGELKIKDTPGIGITDDSALAELFKPDE